MSQLVVPAVVDVTAVAGDDPFEELYRSTLPRLEGALRLAGASRSEAQDLAQEAFTRLLVHWPRVGRGSNPAGYAYRTAFRLLRRAARRRPQLGPAGAVMSAEDHVVLRSAVVETLAALSRRQRECAVLVLYVGCSTEEAAAILGIRAGTVRVHLHAARTALQAHHDEPSGVSTVHRDASDGGGPPSDMEDP